MFSPFDIHLSKQPCAAKISYPLNSNRQIDPTHTKIQIS
jgi:hypothetical protein